MFAGGLYDLKIKEIEIFEDCYLYTAHAEGTAFFLKDENPIVHLSEKFQLFSDFSGLKPNTTKCETAGIVVLKGFHASACGMTSIHIRNEFIKTLGLYFSYNQNIILLIANIQDILNLWRMRNLTLEGRMVVFKTLAISKIVFPKSSTKIPYQVIKELEKMQNLFFGKILPQK